MAIDEAANETKAIKVIKRRDQAEVDGLPREVAIMKKLRHPHIVALYECIDDPVAEVVYLVMQYVPDGPIRHLSDDGTCAPLPVSSVSLYAKQLASALHFMHSSGVTHGDIKPDNILVDLQATPRTAFFADFGVSRTFHKPRGSDSTQVSAIGRAVSIGTRTPPVSLPLTPRVALQSSLGATSTMSDAMPFTQGGLPGVGAPAFLSPEVFAGQVPGYAADIWAFGVTLFVMVYGRLPFRGTSYATVKHNVLNDALVFPPAAPQTQPWAELIAQLLVKDPQRRLTASQLSMSPLLSGVTATSDAAHGVARARPDVGPLPLAPSPSVLQLAGLPRAAAGGSSPPPWPMATLLPIAVSEAEEAAALHVATMLLTGVLDRTHVASDMAAVAMEHRLLLSHGCSRLSGSAPKLVNGKLVNSFSNSIS
jgi:serine/threonine protein kinase